MTDTASSIEKIDDFGCLYREPDVGHGGHLVLLFSWLGASEAAIGNYVKLYASKNVSVLVVYGYLKDFLKPWKARQLARKVLDYVLYGQREYTTFVVHAFSIGAFNFTLCSLCIREHPELYGSFTERLQGIVLDSVVYGNLENMAKGISKISSKYGPVRWLTFHMIMTFFRLNPTTVEFYNRAISHIHDAPFDKPSLFFYCHDDPMCNLSSMQELVRSWRDRIKYPIVEKSWEKSVHTAHVRFHELEYKKTFEEFCDLLPDFFDPKLRQKQMSKL